MISNGLLWYDDDAQRPIALKIAEAAERYRERVGIEPTTCELSPAQTALATAAKEPPARRTRKALAIPAITLHLEANDHLKPNYFLVGVAEGEVPRPVRGWAALEAEPERLPTRRAGRSDRVTATKRAAPLKVTATAPSDAPAAMQEPVAAKPSIRNRAKKASVTPEPESPTRRVARATAEAEARAEQKPQHGLRPEAVTPQPPGMAKTRRTQRTPRVRTVTPAADPVAVPAPIARRKPRHEVAAHDAQSAPQTRKRAAPAAASVPQPVPATSTAPKTTRRATTKPVAKTPARAAKPTTPADVTHVASPAPQSPSKVSKATHARVKVLADAPRVPARAARAARPSTAAPAIATATPAPVSPPAARRKPAKIAEPAAQAKPAAAAKVGRVAKETATRDAPAAQAARTLRSARLKAAAPATPVKATKRSDKPAAQQTTSPAAPRGKATPKAAPQPQQQQPVPVRPSPRASSPTALRAAKRSAVAAAPLAKPATTGRARRARSVAAEDHTQARLWDEPAVRAESTASRRKRSA